MTRPTQLGAGRARVAPALAVIAVLLAAAVAIQVVRDRGWSPYKSRVMWIQSGDVARRLALGFENLLADVYWVRAVVYYGGERLRSESDRDYAQLYPLLDLVTALDPHFKMAYRFGSIFLTEAYPAGPGRPDQALALLERGIARDFGRWEYYFDAAFIHYWWLHDYERAADWFLRASERPGSAEWLKPLAATTLAGANRESSRALWQQMLNSDVRYIRAQAQQRLAQLDAIDTIDRLTVILQRFIDREKRAPASWEELAARERLRAVPVDPAGVRFYFDPKLGYIDLSPKSPLWPLPRDTRRQRVRMP